jgi:hypothetical protein
MKKVILLVVTLVLLAAYPVFSAPFVLDFEGLANEEAIQGYYNGGTGGNGSGPGTNYGVEFVGNALALIDSDAGGTGNFGGEPSPNTAMFFLEGNAATMNVAAGFENGFSFYYTTPFYVGTIYVYDGLNATGNILASLELPLTPDNGAPDPNGNYSPFLPFGVTFSGTAMSVDFAGVADHIAFDNITFGSERPIKNEVPEPFSMILGGIGLGIVGLRKKFAK